ncbi:hypothetical protein KC678_00475 [Candidatus Dojkabacteria bacterium]|uniref:Ribulose-phosphate 3-epimerase n=1 Tax=Candidatus Dojkabacteria bacterium TaxID=2099670 RepID=A0A955IA81_9BACT|nr:hypothetical protein [Candidatus Dojkabacteria bacterium]
MIKISPAILVSSESEIDKQLENYTKIFDQIDIDINVDGDDFEGKVTLDIQKVISDVIPFSDTSFSFHLMVSKPIELINKIEQSELASRIYYIIHQEAHYQEVIEKINPRNLGICIKAESRLKDIDFYKQFKEVQLMTIETGKQGNPFKPEILERVEWLRNEGYEGIVSLDGSINLNTASLVKDFDVNRVSVGSFFSNAEDVNLNKQKLELALNM